MQKLYYLGKPEDGFGWGVANTNIARALEEFCEVVIDTGDRREFDAPVFMPVADHKLTPLRRVAAPRLIGYCFTEWPLTEDARKNAWQYDVLFAGSTWNVQRLAEHGIASEVLHQGIDFDRFKVQPWMPFVVEGCRLKVEGSEPATSNVQPATKFVVFSGGKYEYRKGQDYVTAAMKHFMAAHPDVVLLAAWHNPWPQSMASMQHSWLSSDWVNRFNGLPPERVFLIPPMRNEQTPALYAQAHIGVFPNRCEAGTNLVMCEFMACGRPVIATGATGHGDVLGNLFGEGPFILNNGTYDPAGWFNCNVSDIIARLEHAYQTRPALRERGLVCRKLVEKFTWRACAEKIFRAAFPDLARLQPADHAIPLLARASE